MARIRQLSADMIGRIAAGEVVERPAAAIKELIENSLDAGATEVTVEIRDGGIPFFRVTDNGCGIADSDIRLAFASHATSKVSAAEDLNSIETLGFRGEALASIAAVSRTVMLTRARDAQTGLRVEVEGGGILKITEAVRGQGTTVEVKDLFFNAPVRLKFLKKPASEAALVCDTVAQLILSRPDVRFLCVSNGKTVYRSPGDGSLESASAGVFGLRTVSSLRRVHGCAGGMTADGFVGTGENARGSRGGEMFFINRRVMRSPLLSQAVEEGCRERVMIGKFPVCVLHLTLPYESVDVNVHPNKLEVRFRQEREIKEALTGIVRDALRDRDALENPVPMRLVKEDGASRKAPDISIAGKREKREPQSAVPVVPPVKKPDEAYTCVSGKAIVSVAEPVGAYKIKEAGMKADLVQPRDKGGGSERPAEQMSLPNTGAKKPIKIFGAAFDTFILAEYDDQLLLIDQHAVHERLLFDRMMKTYGQPHEGQELLIPLIVGVTAGEQALVEENRALLESVGLVAEPFGAGELAVRTVPVVLGEAQAAAFVREVISDLRGGMEPGAEKRRAAILQTACKHAVKGGEKLREEDLRFLVEEMTEKKVVPTCPHGRPLVVALSRSEIDKKFRRIV